MKANIAIYNSHEEALKAVKLLKELDFPLKAVSIVGKVEIEDNQMHIKSNLPLVAAPLIFGTTVGATLGLLAGVGVFTVPGFGILMGAGALVGALGGFDFGLISGGIGSILVELGIEDEYILDYDEHLKDGKFLVIINGNDLEIKKAKAILHNELVEYLVS
jgi:uncharacterized membrane protein